MRDSNARLRHSHLHGHTRLGDGVEHHDHEHSHVTRAAMAHYPMRLERGRAVVPVHQNNHHSREELMDLFGRRQEAT